MVFGILYDPCDEVSVVTASVVRIKASKTRSAHNLKIFLAAWGWCPPSKTVTRAVLVRLKHCMKGMYTRLPSLRTAHQVGQSQMSQESNALQELNKVSSVLVLIRM
ncbi:hypothetical protein SCLCIDRAFT_480632 [Scleroderma citrinum Foug A]|uniref:Uncharacterized protein n=1 Tax=Scleroderma citrinum Foug A TaxID=1036808 RepID=A0A0C3DA03_9AGAM|nr:hypothetical protein SCLCIDRAFT_480632 [Scleroderma citrinum Foug A]